MNYLAHAYLSFNIPEVLVGNMISDFVKGKKQYDYPLQIQLGIKLHRVIDTFTDEHQATKALKLFFKNNYGLYAGAFADVVYDYFLANDKTHFATDDDRKLFTQKTYELLEQYQQYFPEKFSRMFPFMKEQDWLYNYAFDYGIEKSFGGLMRRAMYINEVETAFKIFVQNKLAIQTVYDLFFKDLYNFANYQIHILQKP